MSLPSDPTPTVHAARLTPGGERFDAPADVPLLLSAEAAGLALPSSCRNGTCRTCICQMPSGQVTYRIDWPGLSAEEKAEGFILPCVAYPLSDVVLQAEPARYNNPSQSATAWLLAVGTVALWQLDPALVQLGELACTVAAAGTQGMARDSALQLRESATALQKRLAPMGARAVDRVVRRAERASGSVLDKRARLKELQDSWNDLLTCLQLTRR